MAAVVLTIIDEAEAPEVARYLLSRTEEEGFTAREKSNPIDIVTSTIVYKFTNLNRLEIKSNIIDNRTKTRRDTR